MRQLPLVVILCASVAAAAPADDARILRFPDIHGDTIVFAHGGDLWTVSATGGVARRLTTSEGLELFPRFSPDGEWIAFTGQYDGSTDVYVMPAEGGEPRRLTFYPSRDNNERMGWDNMVIGWTPDGRILYRSQRGPIGGFIGQPWTVSPQGGPPERFPLPESGIISFSPDGGKIAYNRNFREFRTWKRYQGGQAQDVWIYDLKQKSIERITDWRGADHAPMWIGESIYFVSDRENWKLNLWRYDTKTKQTTRVTAFDQFDVKWPHAGGGKIVFENGGWIYLYDTAAGGAPRKIDVKLPDDRRLARPRFAKVDDLIDSFDLAPGGKRALFSARGDVFTVPAEHGAPRNLTLSPGSRERAATWSPDGKWVAYIGDATGEEELYVVAQDGRGPPAQVTTGSHAYHFDPMWSPDSKKLAWADRTMRLWYVDVAAKKPVLVTEAKVSEITEYAWSPDSKWLAYTDNVDDSFRAIFIYSLDARASTQATGDFQESYAPAFDPEGKYLYFLSDRDLQPSLGTLDSSYALLRPTRPHALTLRADLASPFAPRNDEVGDEKKDKKPGDDAKKKEAAPPPPVKVDLKGLRDRVVAFPVPRGDYRDLHAAKGKVMWLSTGEAPLDEHAKAGLHVFDLDKRKDTEILTGVDGYALDAGGEKILWRKGDAYFIAEPKEGLKPDEGKVALGLRLELDPDREWAQIFHETWRVFRDFFYLPDMGKIDWPAIEARYRPLLAHVAHRSDLTYVVSEIAAELGSGHAYVGGGEQPRVERTPVGLLGADLELDRKAGLWRIARIIPGQNWDPTHVSPLTQPGVNVHTGEYILAIDGRPLAAIEDPYHLLVNTAGKPVTLTVNAAPSRAGGRDVVVAPVDSEAELRYFDWVETNRRKVDQASGGRVGYVHIPDMGIHGLREFVRQYYPQLRKEGLIVDVRANGGGFVSQMILERLRRKLAGMSAMRGARSTTYPDATFNGPMVCLANMYSASDGDIFPHFFREYGLGPIIGTRTWGGVVGIRGVGGRLVDGGYVFVPEFGLYDLKSEWIVENRGVEPDIVVDNLPQDELAGKDAQLERGIAEVMQRLQKQRPTFPPRPPPKDLTRPTP